jgi:hypothetical protein
MGNIPSFLLGSVFGAYIAQNYDIPDVKRKLDEIKKYINSLDKNK